MSKPDEFHASGGFINDHLVPESHAGDPQPATDSAARLAVRLPLERELSLPVQRRLEYAVASDSFRDFGINE